MKWKTDQTMTSLQRESRRLWETMGENNLSVQEIEAFRKMLHELSWAIAHAQPWPIGHGWSLSRECLDAIKAAADMAEIERRGTHPTGSYVVPMTGGGDVVPFRGRDGGEA